MGHASRTASQYELPGDERRRPISEKLWRRIGFVILALLAYRLGSYITLPGIDVAALMYPNFSDIALLGDREVIARISIFALGIGPYISASILVQVFIWVTRLTPKLIEAERRRRINTYIRVLTVILTLLQSLAIAISLIRAESGWSASLVFYDSPWFIISTMGTLTAGTMFLVWLADEITKRGLGNGVMLILAVGILQDMPLGMVQLWENMRQGAIPPNTLLVMGAAVFAAIALVVFVENARLNISVRFPGKKSENGADREEQLPLRLNLSTIFPPIYASSFLLLPITIFNFTQTSETDWIRLLGQGMPLHMILYAVIIVLLTYAFLPNMGTSQAMAGNLARRGGEIPGVPAGAPTAAYIRRKLLWASAPVPFYLVAICVLPEALSVMSRLPLAIGGVSLLIVVIALSDVIRGVRQVRSGYVTADSAALQFDVTR